SSLVFLSAIWKNHSFRNKRNRNANTCFSTKRSVSSETVSLDFFTRLTALDRTLLRDSLALLPNCLASLAKFSRCSRVTLSCTLMMVPSTSGLSFMLLSRRARAAAAVPVMLTMMSWTLPSLVVTVMWSRAPKKEVRMPRLRLKSSFRASRMDSISSFTSSKLIMSSTSEELMFTLAGCALALAVTKRQT
uniref:Uncharacterized protein n=1 Tax=Denticeps clupeoides TaxID=299321 RepID=A0AAY4E4V9_9TELE